MKYADLSLYIFDMLALVGIVVILVLSPVEDKNKSLDELEKRIYKKRCIVILAVGLLIFILLRLFR